MTWAYYLDRVIFAVEFGDAIPGVSKTFVFGFIVGLVGCYKGYTTENGTEGVGKASTSSVVVSSLLILIFDMFLVKLISLDMASGEVMIEVIDLHKSFNSNNVLDGISFNVDEAENMIVFGRSGTGKSVLLKCMIRLMEPDSGNIKIHGKDVLQLDIKELNELRKNIGFLFQGAALYDSMSVRENLEFPLIRNFDLAQKEIDERVHFVLEAVSLLEAIDKMPSELSGGMKKRIGLARSIITKPKLMFYDEPTTGLDPITAKEISVLIIDLQHQLKMTSVVVTHDLLCAKIIADRAIVLDDGKIVKEGSINDLVTSNDPFLKNFFSDEIIENNGSKI